MDEWEKAGKMIRKWGPKNSCDVCKYYINLAHINAAQGCFHPKNQLLTGFGVRHSPLYHREGPLTGWLMCRLENLCGKEGRWFKRKKTEKRENE